MKKEKSLMYKSLTQFICCVSVLLVLSIPLFYLLTKNFYAEDMIDIIEAVQSGQPVPAIDLEEDILHGIVLQFVLIAGVLLIAIVLMLGVISKRLWLPFDKTLEAMEQFRIEAPATPTLPDSDIREFRRLNAALTKLMTESRDSYCTQKEFIENASHELQTPLAVFQGKLDILLQQPELTEKQAVIIEELYRMNARLAHLNRNLLLLAKMDNAQFGKTDVDVAEVLNGLQPYYESLIGDIRLQRSQEAQQVVIKANRSLLETLVNNLIINAIRHNIQGGEIQINLTRESLTIANTSNEPALDETRIFNRFYHSTDTSTSDGKTPTGNGLGLAIVKAICQYHGWEIAYSYLPADTSQSSPLHRFRVYWG